MPIIHVLPVDSEDLPHLEHFSLAERYECKEKGLVALLFDNPHDSSIIYEIYRENVCIFFYGTTGSRSVNECRQHLLEVMNEKIFLPMSYYPKSEIE